MRTLTQQERVLRSLVQAGPRGINRVDWLGREDTGTPDGGPPIINLPARIMELRQAGHAIVDQGETRERCRVYKLEPAAAEIAEATVDASAREEEQPPARLFPRSAAPGAPATREARPPNPYEYEQEDAA